ncbi:hypothetical protein C8N40_110126 [Pontibacter mucosus]|uniref:DNA-directed DNA polymerase family A palm domain-containing protein n=1 Tax=Pontibacter mucosus TaxID=1649266 RepID=A0A2T5YDT0_9BACT|nr:hypothetical protein [Pontibacter mucosus]PTX14697.1 hypothetical protein C8N40_110126 [Pontibacter mucosus]
MNTTNNSNYEEIYSPVNFDSKEILRQEGWKGYMIESHHQKLDFILHQIYINRILHDKYEHSDFIKLSAKHHIERYLYPETTKKLKPLLKKYGVIEDNGYYRIAKEENGFNGECLGYRLTSKYDVPHRRISVDKHSTLYNNIIRFRTADFKKQDQVTQWIGSNMQDIGIRKDDAIAYVEQWYANAILFINPDNLKKNQHYDDYQKIIESKKERYLYIINAIYDGTIFQAKRDKTGERVHHAISVLWRELRQFLYLRSKPDALLCNLDVANSQPFCLVKILRDVFKDKAKPTSVQTYIKEVSQGTFYHYMANAVGLSVTDFSKFKTDLFANVFYGENEKTFHSKSAQAFMKEFPTVYQVIENEKQGNYKKLAVLMQKVESQAIVDGVMTDLMHKYEDKYFFTSLHDSVIFEYQPELVDEIKMLMVQHMEKVVGLKPTIKKLEYFNLPAATNSAVQQFKDAIEMFEWYDSMAYVAHEELVLNLL